MNQLTSTLKWYEILFLFVLLCGAIDDVDTRAITRRLRQDGSLIGVLSTEEKKTDKELLEMSRTWDIVGKDPFSVFKGRLEY